MDDGKEVGIYFKTQSKEPGSYCLIPRVPEEVEVTVLTH